MTGVILPGWCERPAGKGWRRGPSCSLWAQVVEVWEEESRWSGERRGEGEEEVALPGPLRDQLREGKARCPAGGAEGRWVPRADMAEGPEAQVGLGQGTPPWRRPHLLRTGAHPRRVPARKPPLCLAPGT